MDRKFQEKRLKAATNGAGERYDTVVNIQIEGMLQNLHALNREEPFMAIFLKATYHVVNDIPSLERSDTTKENEIICLANELKSLMDRLIGIKSKTKYQNVRWSSLITALDAVSSTCYDLYSYFREEKEKEGTPKAARDSYSSTSYDLWNIYRGLSDLRDTIGDPSQTKLFNTPRLMLHGEAGIGKTHLLCDYATNRLNAQRATIIYLGHELHAVPGSGDPIERMATLDGFKDKAEFLKALKELAEQSPERVCLIVDAINEGEGIEWEKLIELKEINGLSVVVSLRDGYEFVLGNRKRYTSVRHTGFSEIAWEGVSKFFKHYGLKLPEIPIINPEFKNPLFLRIFCKSYTTPGKTPRGHGATHVFEHYIANQSLKVYKELGVKLPQKYLWINLIKPIGVWMGQNGTNRIPQKKLVEIINQDSNLSAYVTTLPNSLEANGLMIKYPHFTKAHRRSGHAYYFTYQRFSDHLIIRSILTENKIEGPDASTKAREYFNNDPFFDDIIHKYDTGLIEALAIQIPERCKGDELPNLVDKEYRDMSVMKRAFLEGLKWRDISVQDGQLKNFDENQATEYLKKYFRTENDFFEVLACMYDVSAIPEHPFNALHIHKILNRLSLADRDSWFQNFILDNSYDGDAITRLHSWSFSSLITQSSPESADLAATAILWTTASTSRGIRDTSSRAAVAIISQHPQQMIPVFKRMLKCNDPYVVERLFATVYGVSAAVSKDKDTLMALAKLVYENHFLDSKRQPNAIIDDYAHSTIELYIRLYENDAKFDTAIFRPPYNYAFPKQIHTIEWLRKKYYDEQNYYSIWGSLMYNYGSLADFGRYTMGGVLNGFSSYKLKEPLPKSIHSKMRRFDRSLNQKQSALYTEYRRIKSSRFSFISEPSDEVLLQIIRREKNSSDLLKEDPLYFKKRRKVFWRLIFSLPPHKLVMFISLLPYINDKKQLPDRERKNFDLGVGQRWIFQRVIKLGWSPDKHGDFEKYTARDRAVSRDRARIERIGKKYQWIGLHEFTAYVGANFYLAHDDWDSEKEFTQYSGAYEIGVRDFDPTLDPSLVDTRRENEQIKTRARWEPNYNAWDTPGWAHSTADIPPSRSLIFCSLDGQDYLNLGQSVTWKGQSDPPEDEERYNYPQLWMKIQSYIVKKKDLQTIIKWSSDKEFWDRVLPEVNSYSGELFLKEFDGSRAYDQEFKYTNNGWDEKGFDRPFAVNQPVQRYSEGESGSIGIDLPSPFLVKILNLHSTGAGSYLSTDGKLKLFDPSLEKEEFSNTLLVTQKEFLKILDSTGLTVIWTILGEKINIRSHNRRDEYRGQRLEIHGIGHLDNGQYTENLRYKNTVEKQ